MTPVRSDISLWKSPQYRPALSDPPLLAEKTKSKEPNHSYNPALSEATRKESQKGMEVMGEASLRG